MDIRRAVASISAWLAVACSATPTADSVLARADDPTPAPATEGAPVSREALDLRARRSLTSARDAPDDLAAVLRATSDLFTAADFRVQCGSVEALERQGETSVERVITVDDRLPAELRAEVRSLCVRGAELARQALALDPGSARARLYFALHVTLEAWSEGPVRALLAGRGPRVRRAIDDAVRAGSQLGDDLDDAAPIRLEGRFLVRAPWPYRDRNKGLELLERAAREARLPLHQLYLGDALWLVGEREDAAAAWRTGLDLEPSPSTRAASACHAELLRLRIEAASRRGR